MVEQVTESDGANREEEERKRALAAYRRKLAEYREVEQRLKELRKKVWNYRIFF